MLSNKNKNTFVFEEESDHSQNKNKNMPRKENQKNRENLMDSLDIVKDSMQNLNANNNSGVNLTNNSLHEDRIILKVMGEEFQLEGEPGGILVNYLREIKGIFDSKTTKMDLNTSKKIIDISQYIKAFNLIRNIIDDSILPNLEKNTCLTIIRDYIDLIYKEDFREIFIPLIEKCVDIAANNIFYLINNMQEELLNITQDSLEEIIERYFESVMFNVNIDHSLIMRLMMKSRKLNDIYDLLENERRRSISVFEKVYQEGLEPTIIWKIESESPNAGFYKESEEFLFENVSLILINYYDADKDVYSMALKITEIKDKNNQTVETDLSQFIISILSICEIKEINFSSKINFNCIFSNTKTKILVSKIENFSEYFTKIGLKFEDIKFSLVIYFNISYNFSSVLTHICKNFYEYFSLNSISRISRNVLNIIIKNECLNVRSEDEVLSAVMNWINNRGNITGEGVHDIVKNVNWNSVSLDGLLDFILSQSKLLINASELQSIVINEFARRFKDEYGNNSCNNCGFSNSNSLNETQGQCGNKMINGQGEMHSNNGNNNYNTSPRRRVLNAGTNNNNAINNNPNPNHSNSNTQTNKITGSFTSELIQNIIKIASKYETPYNYKSSPNATSKNNIDKQQNHSSRNESNNNQQREKVINTSPDNSVNKSRDKKEQINPRKEISNLKFIGSSDSNNLRKSSNSPFSHTNNIKKNLNTLRYSNIKESNINNSTDLTKKKMFQNNSNQLQSSQIRNKISDNVSRPFYREYSDQSFFNKNKSKSITKDTSVKKSINKEDLTKSNRQNHSVNTKTKSTPLYKNINVNMSNTNLIATVKNKKTPKNISGNNMIVYSGNNSTNYNILSNSGNTIEVNKREGPIISRMSQNVNFNTVNKESITNFSTGGVLSFSKPIENKSKSNKDGSLTGVSSFANVKFIKKESIRPKSATGIRSVNNMNVYKK